MGISISWLICEELDHVDQLIGPASMTRIHCRNSCSAQPFEPRASRDPSRGLHEQSNDSLLHYLCFSWCMLRKYTNCWNPLVQVGPQFA